MKHKTISLPTCSGFVKVCLNNCWCKKQRMNAKQEKEILDFLEAHGFTQQREARDIAQYEAVHAINKLVQKNNDNTSDLAVVYAIVTGGLGFALFHGHPFIQFLALLSALGLSFIFYHEHSLPTDSQ